MDTVTESGLGDHRCHANRDQQSRNLNPELRRIASWWAQRGPAGVLLIHACEVAGIGEQYAHFDYVIEAGAASLQNGLAVGQRLARLELDGIPARSPVLGSMPVVPATNSCDPAFTPWLYSGELGASGVAMICLGISVLSVREVARLAAPTTGRMRRPACATSRPPGPGRG